MRFPVEDPEQWNTFGRLSWKKRLEVAWRSRQYYQRATSRDGISLSSVRRDSGPLTPADVVLICVVRNGEDYLPSLLTHYRKLGISSFAFVDDSSGDGTRPLLLDQPDVDLFESNVGFRESEGGLVWRDMLVELYGRNRWYLSIDSDEYLIFPGCEQRAIGEFATELVQNGRQRALAAMVDIYPDGILGAAEPLRPPDLFPTSVCPLFDGDGYTLANEKFCTAVRGGPRKRLFGADMRLSKFPLIYAGPGMQFAGGTHHGPLPLKHNYGPVQAVLLHHRFAHGSVRTFRSIAEQRRSFFYKMIVEQAGFSEDTDLRYAGSRRFEGSEAMVAAGFMQDLRRF